MIHDTEGSWFDYCSAEWTSAQKRAYKSKYGDLVVQSSQGEMVGTKDNPYMTRKITQAEATGNVYVDTPASGGNLYTGRGNSTGRLCTAGI